MRARIPWAARQLHPSSPALGAGFPVSVGLGTFNAFLGAGSERLAVNTRPGVLASIANTTAKNPKKKHQKGIAARPDNAPEDWRDQRFFYTV